jgi:integrase
MNLLALKGEVSCKRYIVYEVRSVRKLFNYGVYYHFSFVLPILTALKGGVLDPTANKNRKLEEVKKGQIAHNRSVYAWPPLAARPKRRKQHDVIGSPHSLSTHNIYQKTQSVKRFFNFLLLFSKLYHVKILNYVSDKPNEMRELNLLTITQLANVLDVHEDTLSLLVESGQIPHTFISTSSTHESILRFNPGRIMDWMKEGLDFQTNNEQRYIDTLKKKMTRDFPVALKTIKKLNEKVAPKRTPKGYTLSKVPSKKYVFIYYVRYMDKGGIVPSRWSTGTNSLDMAKTFAVANRAKILNEYYSKETRPVSIYRVLRNFYKPGSDYLETVRDRGRKLSDHTALTYFNFIDKKFLPFLKQKHVKEFKDITPPLILKFQNKLLKTNKPQTVNYFIGAIKTAFDYLVMDGTVQDNVFSKTSSLTIAQSQKQIRGCYDLDEIYGVFNRRWPDQFARLLCLMIYTTGLRNSEIERIREQDIVKINGIRFINIQASKTENGIRMVPLHPFVYERIKRYLAKNGAYSGGYIFFPDGKNNESIVYNGANIVMGKMIKRTGEYLASQGITFYSGRHYWKTLMNAEKLGDVEEFFMGHKASADVAKRYNHKDKQGKAMLAKKAKEVFRILDKRLFRN